MNVENEKLLDELNAKNLQDALNETDPEKRSKLVKEAMEGISKSIEIEKLKNAKAEKKKNDWIDIGAKIAVPLVSLGVTLIFEGVWVTRICNFEKDYTFSNMPGKVMVPNLFRKH